MQKNVHSACGFDEHIRIRYGWHALIRDKWARFQSLYILSLGRHEDLFKDELGLLKGCAVTIRVKASAKPLFYKPRSAFCFAREGRTGARQTGENGRHQSSDIFGVGCPHCTYCETRWQHSHLWGLQTHRKSGGRPGVLPISSDR